MRPQPLIAQVEAQCTECGSFDLSYRPWEDYPELTAPKAGDIALEEIWCANCERILPLARVMRAWVERIRTKATGLESMIQYIEVKS